ncbi:TonB-dependent receptor, partial [Bradyrhizobium sp. 18BD]
WSRVSSGQLFAGTYDYLPTYTKGTIWNNNPSLSYGSQLFTSGLLPQTSDSYETGFEAKLFKSRLTIDATYFQTRDYNNITNNPISNTSGFDSQLLNGNVYQRKGYELVLGATAVKTHDLRWNIGVNLSTYHNYLKEIYGGATYLNNLKAG